MKKTNLSEELSYNKRGWWCDRGGNNSEPIDFPIDQSEIQIIIYLEKKF